MMQIKVKNLASDDVFLDF